MIGSKAVRGRHCDHQFLQTFTRGDLPLDEELSFLIHLDDCNACWDLVYEA